MSFEFPQARVAAVYPSFALIHWLRPLARPSAPPVQTPTWVYAVEWSCASDPTYKSFTCDGATQIALPLEYLKEEYYVRVLAKSSAESVPNILSSSLSFYAECNVWMPWMQEGALSCRCIFDGLYLSCYCSERTVAHLAAHTGGTMRYEGMCVMKDQNVAHIVEATFAEPPFPLEHRNVVYIIPCPLPSDGTMHRKVEEYMSRPDCGIVFLGVGAQGEAMTKSLLSSIQLLDSVEPLKRGFFCITYGAERTLFAQPGIRFTRSCLLSGNFLTYSGSHDPSDHCCVFNSEITTQVSSCKRATTEAVFTNAPLGVRVGVKRKVLSNTLALQADVQLKTVGCDRAEHFNASTHLALLRSFFFPDKLHILSPSITRAACATVSTACVVLQLEGINLQFKPTLTCLCQQEGGGRPVEIRVTAADPCSITAEGFIGEVVAAAVAAAAADKRAPPTTLTLMVLAQTNFGVTTTEVTFHVPVYLLRLFSAGSSSGGDRPTRTSPFLDYPSRLYDGALALQPFATRLGTMSESMRLLNLLLTTAEIARGNEPQQSEPSPSSGLLSFIAGITSKSSGKKMAGPDLYVPPFAHDSAFLRRSVDEVRETGDIATFTKRASSWKRRIFSGIRHLDDTQYVKQLVRALLFFDVAGDVVGESSSLPVLELLLYARIAKHVGRRCRRLTAEITVEDFYQRVHTAVASKLEGGAAGGGLVASCMFLFAVCATVELRLCCTSEAYILILAAPESFDAARLLQKAVKGLILSERPSEDQNEDKLLLHLVVTWPKDTPLLSPLLKTEARVCVLLMVPKDKRESLVFRTLHKLILAAVDPQVGQRLSLIEMQEGGTFVCGCSLAPIEEAAAAEKGAALSSAQEEAQAAEESATASSAARLSLSVTPSDAPGERLAATTESVESTLIAAFGHLQCCVRLL